MEHTAHPNFTRGDFLTELLYTDTLGWEVVATTERTITIRRTLRGHIVRNDHLGGNPYPVTYYEMKSDAQAPVRTLRLRKDGTFRLASRANPLMLASRIEDTPVEKVDYRY